MSRVRFGNFIVLLVLFITATSSFAQKESSYSSWLRLKDLKDDSSKLLQLIEKAGDPDIQSHPDTIAFFLYEIAKTHWTLGNKKEVLETDQKAVALRRPYRQSDPENYCRSAFNLGIDFVEVDMGDSAIYYLNEVIQISPVNRQKSRAAYTIGSLYKANGEFSLGLFYGRQALQYGLADTLHEQIQAAYILLLDTYNLMLHQGDYQVIDSIFQTTAEAKSYLAGLQDPDADAIYSNAKFHLFEGHAYKMQESYDSAEFHMALAQQLFTSSGYDDPTFASELFNSRGIILRRLGRYTEARKMLNEALAMRMTAGDSINVAVTENNLGDLYLDQKNFPEALRHYSNSLWSVAGKAGRNSPEALPRYAVLENHPYLFDCFRYVVFLADAWSYYCSEARTKEFCSNALKAYALGDSLVDAFRSRHLQEGSKLFWREDAKTFYTGAIATALYIGDVDLAVYYSDRSKAVLVLDAMQEHMVRDSPAKTLIERKDSLLQVMVQLEKRGKTDEQWISANSALDQINDQLKKVLPGTIESSFQYTNEKFAEYYQHLSNDEAIIHFFDAHAKDDRFGQRDSLFAFVIRKSGVRHFGLQRPFFVQAMKQYQEGNRTFLTEGIVIDQHEGADPLFIVLIEPLGSLPENITIIPDGVIAQISFDGLRDGQGRYLVESKTIRYDLSLAMADAMRKVASANNGSVLALAPMTQSICNQQALPFTRGEISGIGEIVECNLLFGSEASRAQLFELHPDYSILHLATHASANTTDPGNSWIALAGDTTDCDFLYVHDLYTTHIPSSMVVVSACEGAYGTYAAGEGAMSVARGFAFAGASSIVTSLWQVNDQAAADIMKSYYSHLLKGMTKSGALRQAKLDYLHDEHRKKTELHPAWWSAFIVIGNDAPVELEAASRFEMKYVWIVGVVFIVILILYFRIRDRSKIT